MIRDERPRQSKLGLWNISFGFFGIQIAFALQNSNMSRIFQTLGSSVDNLPALWVAAPLTGLLIQPIIGYASDRTWLGRFGRRRPYFLAGAILASLALVLMPLAGVLVGAALLLWMLDASLNVSMEPFRAFVGDMLPPDQHTSGYAVQTGFIGGGAVVGSIFPYVLDQFGISNVAPAGLIPATVRYSFWVGALALLGAVSWTVVTTREYGPDELARYRSGIEGTSSEPFLRALASRRPASGALWVLAGGVTAVATLALRLEREVYLLSALLAGYGLALATAIARARRGASPGMLAGIVGDFNGMPPIMKRLAWVQFFSWSALFIMWINTTPVVAMYYYQAPNSEAPAYQEASNWVGVLFSVYNGIAACAAIGLLPLLARHLGVRKTHIIGLLSGAAGFASFFLFSDPKLLLLSELGIGVAWASILSLPYAILASNVPQPKLGIYMGLFNVFVVLPQLLVATVMGSIMKAFFPTEPIYTMAFAAGTLVIAAAAMLRVQDAAKGQAM